MSAAAPATGESERPTTLSLPPRRLRVEAIAAGGEFTLAARPAGERPRRRRRRHGKFLRDGAPASGESVAAAPGDAPQPQQSQQSQQPQQQRPRRERGPRRDQGGKGFGKGRGEGRRDKPAPKLYSFESVVDRGFEDITAAPASDDANEGGGESGTRRVDWTIVKRTVADQRAAKTVSALYVLKRDGAETEFPNLGAARAAVNKTIVHPEKLTRPKADYPNKK